MVWVIGAPKLTRWPRWISTSLAMPVASGNCAILPRSVPVMQAAMPRVMPAAVQAVTQPHSAPVASAITAPARFCSSSRSKKSGRAAVACAAIAGRTAAPARWVILPQALMTRVNWYFSYRSMLVSVRLLAGLASVNFLAARRWSFCALDQAYNRKKIRAIYGRTHSRFW